MNWKGSGGVRGLLELLNRHLSGMTKENHENNSVKIAGVPIIFPIECSALLLGHPVRRTEFD
jgi:hypothetical protein